MSVIAACCRNGKEVKRQKAKGKNQKVGTSSFPTYGLRCAYRLAQIYRFTFAFCLFTFAFCLNSALAQTPDKLPLLYWPNGIETASALKQAGIERIAVPPAKVAAWRKAGFNVTPMTEQEFAKREKLLAPKLGGRGANVASATRRPWIDANGWRFMRNPSGKFAYDLSPTQVAAGRTGRQSSSAALAAAEAFAYGADVVIKLGPNDLSAFSEMLKFLRTLPTDQQPNVSDIGLIDDGSPLAGEVMNLFTRRNLLFQPAKQPLKDARLNIKLGTKEFPESEAADPNQFAQTVRRKLGDDRRTLRVYGAEIVICRLTSDGKTTRLHLLNYSGREVDSLRISVRGIYDIRAVQAFTHGTQTATDVTTTNGVTEFSIPRLASYGFVELVPRR